MQNFYMQRFPPIIVSYLLYLLSRVIRVYSPCAAFTHRDTLVLYHLHHHQPPACSISHRLLTPPYVTPHPAPPLSQ